LIIAKAFLPIISVLSFMLSVTLKIRKVTPYFVFPCSFFTWFGDTELKSLADGVQDEVKTHVTLS
jgi:hypothetical protein